MRRALRELGVATWFAGLRRKQSESRSKIPFLDWAGGRWKVHPIADWNDREVHYYLKKHNLPYHPLWEQGYLSIGCAPCTRPGGSAADPRAGRWLGQARTECGIHG